MTSSYLNDMYDVTDVNVFPRKLMEFPRKEKVNSVPYPLLSFHPSIQPTSQPASHLPIQPASEPASPLSSRIYENLTSWLLEATQLKLTQLKKILTLNSALTQASVKVTLLLVPD